MAVARSRNTSLPLSHRPLLPRSVAVSASPFSSRVPGPVVRRHSAFPASFVVDPAVVDAAVPVRAAFHSCRVSRVQGECKYVITEDGHKDWVSCVRFPPIVDDPIIVSCGWDKLVKVWKLATFKLRTNLGGHTGYVSTVTVSPDGSLCASGGKDKTAMLWDLNEGKRLYSLEAGSAIHSLVFSPNRYWLCAATDKCIKVCARHGCGCGCRVVATVSVWVEGWRACACAGTHY